MRGTEVGIGGVLAGHRLDAAAGRGGMGMVYRATHLALGRTVALKVIAPTLAGDPDFRERFRREARTVAALEHPHVIPVYDAGDADGHLYVTMRWVSGEDLGARLGRGGALAPSLAAPLLGQVADALHAAHEAGLVHRDVKPANILLEDRADGPFAFLTDFGLTKRVESETRLTEPGAMVGTVDYLAPEQARGGPVDRRADVYALGCVLFETLTGEVPFRRDSALATLFAHANEPPPRPSECGSGLGSAWDAVVARAMAKDPPDRYPTAAEFGAAVADAAGSQETVVGERALASTTIPPATTVAGALPGTAPRHVPHARRWALLLGILLAAFAVAGAVIALVIGGGSRSQPPAPEKPTAPPGAGRLEGRPIPVAEGSRAITVAGGAVWVLSDDGRSVTRYREATGRPIGQADVLSISPSSIVSGEGGVYVLGFGGSSTVLAFDARTGRQRASASLPDGISDLAVGNGSVYAIAPGDAFARPHRPATVLRLDPENLGVQARRTFPPPLAHLAAGGGSVWVVQGTGRGVIDLDAQDLFTVGTVLRPPAGLKVTGVGFDDRAGLLALNEDKRPLLGRGVVPAARRRPSILVRVPPGGRKAQRLRLLRRSDESFAVGHGAYWIVGADGSVRRADLRTGRAVGRPISTGAPVDDISVGRDVWVLQADRRRLLRIVPGRG